MAESLISGFHFRNKNLVLIPSVYRVFRTFEMLPLQKDPKFRNKRIAQVTVAGGQLLATERERVQTAKPALSQFSAKQLLAVARALAPCPISSSTINSGLSQAQRQHVQMNSYSVTSNSGYATL